MSRKLIAKKLENAMGLHAPTVGMVTISSAIDKRMRACKIIHDDEYLIRISSDIVEMKELIETVITPETWFYRENEPYSDILEHINSHSRPTPVKILSMPCSTGEEPYSIAMMLMENNVPSSRYAIDAIDIAEMNIVKAKQGRYTNNSFRSKCLDFIKDNFSKDGGVFILSDNVKEKVNFHCGNVLEHDFSLIRNTYDIIFCRNLLIYFNKETQRKMFSILGGMLNASGILILGHAETAQHSKGLFLRATNSKSIIYIKKDNLKKLKINENKKNTASRRSITSKVKTPNDIPKPFSAYKNTVAPSHQASQDSSEQQLGAAFEMADQGRLSDALQKCEQYLQKHNDSSRAYYLSGIIYGTQGHEDKASEYLRKSIYLDPHNIEALIHLSLIAEQRGNHVEATRLKQRANRIKENRADS